MNNKQLAQVLREALPMYTQRMEHNTAFMCLILSERRRRHLLSEHECDEANKRITDKINGCITLYSHMEKQAGRKIPLHEFKHNAVKFWHEWIHELEKQEEDEPMNNKQLARVLRVALPAYTDEMDNGRTPFMCITLKEIAYEGKITLDEWRGAQELIEAEIRPAYTLLEHLRNRADRYTHKSTDELKEDAVKFWHTWIEILESS